jgi:2'-5' RNA ligase
VTQLTLPGFEAPNLALEHRLFFALVPDPLTAEHIAGVGEGVCSQLGIRSKLLRTERLHITLHHLGDFPNVPEVIVARACAAAASLVVPPFEVTFDRVLSFKGRPGHRPLVLTGETGLNPLIDFQQALGEALGKALGKAGLRLSRARFTPHLTLLYDEGKFDPRPIEHITWTVRDFVLIHSWLGKTLYVEKGRWPLKG